MNTNKLFRLARHIGSMTEQLWIVLAFWMLGACTLPQQAIPATLMINSTPSPPEAQNTITFARASESAPPTITGTPKTQRATPTLSFTQNKASPTIVPSHTPTVEVWSSVGEFYPLVAIAFHSPKRLLLFSPDGAFLKEYDLGMLGYTPLQVQQVRDDCKVITLVNTDDGHKLIFIDPGDKLLHEYFHLPHDKPDVLKYISALSPSRQFVAYIVFSGELYYDSAQYQNVEIIDMTNLSQPIRLTLRGGAWKRGGDWSPDGNWLAYTDYDGQGNLQVYITSMADMKQLQLTQFQNSGTLPGPLKWSPVGDRLAITLEDHQGNEEVWIIQVSQGQAYKLALPDNVVTIGDKLFWSEDGTKLALHIGDYTNSGLAGFYWFDVEVNRLLHVFTEKAASQINPRAEMIAFPFPLTTDLSVIGYFSGKGEWYSYNGVNGQIEQLTWLDRYQQEPGLLIMDVSVFTGQIGSCIK